MMKDHVFGHGTTTSMLGSPQHCKIATLKEEKVREKAKVDSGRLKSIGNAYLGEEQTQDTGQKKTVLGRRQERLFERQKQHS